MCARYGSTVEEELELSQEYLKEYEDLTEKYPNSGWIKDGLDYAKERLASAEAAVAAKYEDQRAKVAAARERAAKARAARLGALAG